MVHTQGIQRKSQGNFVSKTIYSGQEGTFEGVNVYIQSPVSIKVNSSAWIIEFVLIHGCCDTLVTKKTDTAVRGLSLVL